MSMIYSFCCDSFKSLELISPMGTYFTNIDEFRLYMNK